ncbi:MAG TPA: GlsB/YeaQ/YmgE family stress response membrane protein [Actinomycetes bacterium]|nr:GlsB/YeaQ/YmgE family stress response membrane protein [Actinomycetes bacterium]
MTIEGIIGALIIGAIIGVLGRLIVPGKQDIPIWLTIAVGIVAALIGSAIVGPLRDTDGIDWVELIVQVALAALGVYLVASLRGRGRTTHHV